MRVFMIGEDGYEMAFYFMGPGEIFGEMSPVRGYCRAPAVWRHWKRTITLELDQDGDVPFLQRSRLWRCGSCST